MSASQSDPSTVFVGETLAQAEAVIAFLASQNLQADVFTAAPRVDSEPITGVSDVSGGEAFEVRVTEPGNVDEANKLLDDVQKAALMRAVREKRLQRTGTLTVTCEECGKPSEWPASAMGTTETCPHCMSYIDVPDPDDDWSGVDFGEPED